mgnify:CR=1 FL=1
MRILVVEDDINLNRQLVEALHEAGYVVDKAFDGEEGHFLGDTEPYDAVILDIGLPEMDGITLLEKWRASGRVMPVLILTARDRWSDKVAGIDAGADDYVTKPFSPRELCARERALLRRAEAGTAVLPGPRHAPAAAHFHHDADGARIAGSLRPAARAVGLLRAFDWATAAAWRWPPSRRGLRWSLPTDCGPS